MTLLPDLSVNRRAITAVVAALSGAIVLSGLAAVASPGIASAQDQAVALSRGHLDAMEVTFDPATSKPRLLVKDDTQLYADTTVFRSPGDVTIDIDDERAAFEVPADLGSDYAFLGEPGDIVYLVPEVQDPELPWPGWSTERLQASTPPGITLASGPDAVELDVDVTGPGNVHTFMSGPFGEVINHYVDTTDAEPDVIPVGTSNHVHTTWLFTEQGTYTITVTPTVKTAAGGRITGDASTYAFHVGDPLAPITPSIVPGSEPKILGTPAIGAELYAGDGEWKPTPTEYVARQWLRDGVAIPGAVDSTYTVAAADAGHQLTFRSTVRIGRVTADSTSNPVTVLGPAPVNTQRPAVSGSTRYAQVLTAVPGAWSVSGLTFSYQWTRNGRAISGATRSSYRTVLADIGRTVAVRVTARRPDLASGSATSLAHTIRHAVAPRPVVRPQVLGRALVGRTLTVRVGRWTPAATSYVVHWRVGTRLLANRTTKLTLLRAWKGKRITATVFARRPGHLTGRYAIIVGRVR